MKIARRLLLAAAMLFIGFTGPTPWPCPNGPCPGGTVLAI